jgi:hypothetical protein
MKPPGQGPPAQTSTDRSQPTRHSHSILLGQCQGDDVYKAQGVSRGLSSVGAPHLLHGSLRPGGPKDSSPRREPWVGVGDDSPAPEISETGDWKLATGNFFRNFLAAQNPPREGTRPTIGRSYFKLET